MLTLVLLVASACTVVRARPSVNYLEEPDATESTTQVRPEEVRSDAIKRLLAVFGMDDPPAGVTHGRKQPPQYMLDLYNTVADVDGVTKDPYLLEGNTVRSFFDKRKSQNARLKLFAPRKERWGSEFLF